MTALEIKAIKKLPENYVQDGTIVWACGDDERPSVIVANPKEFVPLILDFDADEWRPLKE